MFNITKLFIGGFPYSIDNQKLNDLFSQFGQVVSAIVITDKFTGQSKGFGFVEMADDAAAQEAIKNLDGSDLEGRKLGVSVARPREERPANSYSDRNSGGYNKDNNRNFYKRGGR